MKKRITMLRNHIHGSWCSVERTTCVEYLLGYKIPEKRRLYLCKNGLRQRFRFPSHVTKLDIVITDRKPDDMTDVYTYKRRNHRIDLLYSTGFRRDNALTHKQAEWLLEWFKKHDVRARTLYVWAEYDE